MDKFIITKNIREQKVYKAEIGWTRDPHKAKTYSDIDLPEYIGSAGFYDWTYRKTCGDTFAKVEKIK